MIKLAANVEIVRYNPLILREGKPKKIPIKLVVNIASGIFSQKEKSN